MITGNAAQMTSSSIAAASYNHNYSGGEGCVAAVIINAHNGFVASTNPQLDQINRKIAEQSSEILNREGKIVEIEKDFTFQTANLDNLKTEQRTKNEKLKALIQKMSDKIEALENETERQIGVLELEIQHRAHDNEKLEKQISEMTSMMNELEGMASFFAESRAPSVINNLE